MEIYGLIFLITVGLTYAVSVRIESVQWYKEVIQGHGFGKNTPQANIENWYYIPSILGSIVVVLWYWLMKDPYEPIRILIPSYAEAGWLWSIGGAYLVCIPFGLTMGSIALLARVRPESKWMTWVEFVMSYLSWILQVIILFHVYNPWVIWIPMMFTMPLTWIIEKRIPRGFYRNQYNTVTPSSASAPRRSSTPRPPYASPYPRDRRHSSPDSSSSSASDLEAAVRAQRREEYYYQYQLYQDQAQKLLSDAESYDRTADDNEYWAKEFNDSFKASEARHDRNRASRLRYEAQRAQREADRYYNLYQQNR